MLPRTNLKFSCQWNFYSKTTGNCFLNIYTVPWSNIYIDGLSHGTTPTPSLIDLTEGDHVIILEREGFLPIVQGLSIKAGDTVRLKIYLKKQ